MYDIRGESILIGYSIGVWKYATGDEICFATGQKKRKIKAKGMKRKRKEGSSERKAASEKRKKKNTVHVIQFKRPPRSSSPSGGSSVNVVGAIFIGHRRCFWASLSLIFSRFLLPPPLIVYPSPCHQTNRPSMTRHEMYRLNF